MQNGAIIIICNHCTELPLTSEVITCVEELAINCGLSIDYPDGVLYAGVSSDRI